MRKARPPSPIPTSGRTGPILFRSTYLRQVGGTTWHWLGTALRLLPHDFELRSRYGVGVDWPLTYADLAPWYDAAESELGVSGHDDPLGSPRRSPYPMPGLPATLGDRLMDQASAPLGFRVRVSPQARNAQPFDNRPACCASSSCIPICPVQAKYDATVHVRKAEAAGARILAESVAVRVEVAPDGLVSGILIRRPDRSETSLNARHVVIAAHAIEGPKLLLMSRSERYPNGVANSSDAVGRYLMDHPVQLTRALSPVPVWQRRGPQEVSAIHDMRDGDHRRQHGALLINVGNQGWEWAGPNLADLAKRYVEAGLSGSELLNAVRSHASRETTLVALTEQLPDPDNRVTPDFERLDAIGVPKPRIFFRLDPYTTAALAAARANPRAAVSSAGRHRHRAHTLCGRRRSHHGHHQDGNRSEDVRGERERSEPRSCKSLVCRLVAVPHMRHREPDPDHRGACVADRRGDQGCSWPIGSIDCLVGAARSRGAAPASELVSWAATLSAATNRRGLVSQSGVGESLPERRHRPMPSMHLCGARGLTGRRLKKNNSDRAVHGGDGNPVSPLGQLVRSAGTGSGGTR